MGVRHQYEDEKDGLERDIEVIAEAQRIIGRYTIIDGSMDNTISVLDQVIGLLQMEIADIESWLEEETA